MTEQLANTRTFGLGDLLSVTTGKLVSRRHMGGVHAVLDHMTDDQLYTHQLPRAADQCRPELLRQHPWLGEITVPDHVKDEATALAWLEHVEKRYGAEHPVTSGAPGYQHKDPLAELDQMMGSRPVITIDPNVPPDQIARQIKEVLDLSGRGDSDSEAW